MSKKVHFILLVFVLFSVGILGACANNAQMPATGQVELKFANKFPPGGPTGLLLAEWVNRVEEKSGGTVKITNYGASSLLGEEDALQGTLTGICDISHITPMHYADARPLTPLFTLPFMGLGDEEICNRIWQELYDDNSDFRAEYADFKVLHKAVSPTQIIHTRDKLVRVPNDLKGVKIFAPGEMQTVLKEAGASPVFVATSDWYTSLERGVIDGMVIQPYAITDMDLVAFLPYHTLFPEGLNHGNGHMIMNLDKWNSLSPKAQKAINDLEDWFIKEYIAVNKAQVDDAINQMKQQGHTFVTVTAEEEQLWADAAKSTREAYLGKHEKDCPAIRQIYNEIIELYKKYSK